MPIDSLLLEQLGVCAFLEDLALTQDIDNIGILDRRQPVCNRNHCATLSRALQGCLNQLLAFCYVLAKKKKVT